MSDLRTAGLFRAALVASVVKRPTSCWPPGMVFATVLRPRRSSAAFTAPTPMAATAATRSSMGRPRSSVILRMSAKALPASTFATNSVLPTAVPAA